jgi:hypothetical protein
LALSSRFTATNASFSSWLIRYPPPLGACAIVAAGGFTTSASFSNGPSNPSRIRSNFTPIE